MTTQGNVKRIRERAARDPNPDPAFYIKELEKALFGKKRAALAKGE